MSSASESKPFLVVTCILDAGARAAAVTRAHGEAFERAIKATAGLALAGLDIVELLIDAKAHEALRKQVGAASDAVGLYDLFPLSNKLDPTVRKAAAQFLAAEQLWTLDAQGVFGESFAFKLDLPSGWDKAPQAIHEKLVQAGALELSDAAIETFRTAKERWSQQG